jgi:dGTPase
MKDHGGFEGNGQTLRIIARLGEYSLDHGLDLTRRTMLGVLKYPVLHRDVSFYSEPENGNSDFRNIDYAKPPKCIHDEETEILDWILHPLSDRDNNLFRTIDRHSDKHSKSIYKSFDTSIMELADDIAYGVHDLEDAVARDLVTLRQWKNQVASTIETMPENDIKSDLGFYKDNLFSDSSKYRKHAISKLVNYFIKSIEMREDQKFECQLLRYQAQMMSPAAKILSTFKKFVFDHVILRPEVQGLEFKGQQTVLRLFEVLFANPHRLLQKSDFEKYGSSDNKQRVICDYVAGMTDPYATRLYHRLFTPDVGSLFDRL